ncbi:MAG: methyltransferase domain-containing protein [Pirellulales bacterium]
MLDRILEPEVMDTRGEAIDYDVMDHAEVNRRFVDDLIAAGLPEGDCLDLGTGTAQIPIELAKRTQNVRIWAVDLAGQMLAVGRANVSAAALTARIELQLADAKRLPYPDGRFASVMSNSIVHHVPRPEDALAEAIRVTAPAGLLFVRDLMRPDSRQRLESLVEQHAGTAGAHQRKMFADSLHAALTLEEMRQLVEHLGYAATDVGATSDRHWTWTARKNR